MQYAELLCKTNFSFLEGGSHPGELIERAHELGLKALAITDRNGVYGIPRAYLATQSYPIHLITGAELTLEGHSLTLLAQDRAAYGVLCRIITTAHADKPKGEAKLRWEELLEHLERPGARGLIAIPQGAPYAEYRELFGPENVYLPLRRILDGRDRERTERTLAISRRYGIPIVATNDVHYHHPERRKLQDVLTATRLGTTLQGAGKKLFSNAERHLKSGEEMARLFRDLPDAIHRTVEIAERCTFSPSELRYRYPSEWIPKGDTAQSYLERLVWQGAQWRYPQGIPDDVMKQLRHELALVSELSYADYFLTIWEIVEFARKKQILCQGRGSAANSAICYCLGITAIDPVRMDLLFERFISAERGEPPDIDVDFEHERREEVIQHIYQKYGRDRAAMVSAVVTYRSRLAAREIKKALDVQKGMTELSTKLAEELYGFPRHLSIHSGGFTLSADPIIETVPVEPARMEDRTIIQWDKYDLDTLGLLKVDVLSLGMLTAVRKTLDYVGNGLSFATIPPEDPATYRMIQRADTVGTFQIESRAQMSMLPRLLPKTFYDLVVQLAIVRPGPIVGKLVHPYLKRRQGLESPDIPDPRLIPILGRTLGVPLFQEQIMKIAVTMAGFTPGESDELRRAIGAWRSSGSIEKMGKKLKQGLLASGLSEDYVSLMFGQIQGFAEYGFPESHSASFALIAYVSAYLRCHYPAEFACALINSQPMGFYSVHTIVDDAKRHGVSVLPIDPQFSQWDCHLERRALRLGFRLVHGMHRAQAEALIAARARKPFRDLHDFLARVRVRPGTLQRMALGDAFRSWGYEQRDALWEILAFELLHQRETTQGQLSLFSSPEAIRPAPTPDGLFEKLNLYQAIHADYEAYGASTRGHPMQALRERLPELPRLTSAKARLSPRGRVVRIAGLVIVRQRPPTANQTMFATLEDETGFFDLILKREVHEKYDELFRHHSFLIAEGVIQRDRNAVSMLVKRLEPIFAIPNTPEEPRIGSRDFQ